MTYVCYQCHSVDTGSKPRNDPISKKSATLEVLMMTKTKCLFLVQKTKSISSERFVFDLGVRRLLMTSLETKYLQNGVYLTVDINGIYYILGKKRKCDNLRMQIYHKRHVMV